MIADIAVWPIFGTNARAEGSRMRFVVHIGMHKTGTTSIQRTLFKNHAALRKQGIFYPVDLTIWAGHHQLAWSLGVDHPDRNRNFRRDAALAAYMNAARSCDTLVLSSEDFELAPEPAVKAFVAELQQRGSVEVVCYFRHSADWVQSAFKWHAWTETARFHNIDQYLEKANLHVWLDYRIRADRWALPGVTFTPRAYTSDVVQDFLKLLRATASSTASKENVSTRNLTAKLLTELGQYRHLTDKDKREVDRRVRSATDKDINLLTRERYADIMNIAGAQNAQFIGLHRIPDGERLLHDNWRPSELTPSDEMAIADNIRACL